jgi:hypothetical protein
MKSPKFSFSDVLAILGFGFGLVQIPSQFSKDNPAVWITISTCAMVLLACILYIRKLKKENRFSFRLIDAERGKEGDDFVLHIRNAKRHIRVIHTISKPPGEKFTLELLDRLSNKIEIIRVIPDGLTKLPSLRPWLDRFHGLEHYSEHVIPGERFRMPFSFVIIDDREVFAYFPDSDKTETETAVIHINNREVATMFRNVFIKLLNQATEYARVRDEKANIRGDNI